MKVAIMYSGLMNESSYEESKKSLHENLLDCNEISSFKIYEYFKNIPIENKYSKYDGGPTHVRTETIQPMFHKIFECNQLLGNNSFDVCVRIRPDFILNTKINIKNLNLSKYTIPDYGTCRSGSDELICVCDFFCISSQKKMNHYCEIYNSLELLFETTKYKNPECLLVSHLGSFNIDLVDIDHHLKRPDGSTKRYWKGFTLI